MKDAYYCDDHFNKTSTNEDDGDARDCHGESESGMESRHKAYLKQNIFFHNNAEYDARGPPGATLGGQLDAGDKRTDNVGHQIHIDLLLTILSAIRHHAVSDRIRLVELVNQSTLPKKTDDNQPETNDITACISKTNASFHMCIDILVDIGERILLRLPTNSSTCRLGGMIVRGLLEAYLESNGLSCKENVSMHYLAHDEGSNLRSMIDPLRYADAVSNSSENPLLDTSREFSVSLPGKHNITTTSFIAKFIQSQPPKDVQDIVKALFMRDLVDLKISGCGYGDFLSWCHLPIAPEPLLFDYVSNFPDLSDEDAEEPLEYIWAKDEVSFQKNGSTFFISYNTHDLKI